MKLSELRKKANSLQPIVRIGKLGLNESVLNEILKHLKSKKLIKIKLLSSSLDGLDKNSLADEISEKTNSKVVQVIGNTMVLYKS